MLPFHEIKIFLQHTHLHLQEIVLELRNLIAEACAQRGRDDPLGQAKCYHEGGGGIVSAGISQISIHKDHVRLEFIHKTFFPDPRSI